MPNAFETGLRPYSLEAGEDLTGKQFFCVKVDSNSQLLLPTDITDPIHGIIQTETDTIGRAVAVATKGVSKAVAAAAITAGALLESAVGGKVQAHTTGTIIGTAVTGAANADEIVSVDLDRKGGVS